MAEFFGTLERLAADLYPWRYLIGAGLLVAVAASVLVAYRKGWHLWVWRHRIPAAIVGTPLLVLVGFLAYDLGSPLFTNVTVEEEFPFAFSAAVPPDMDMEDIEKVMEVLATVKPPMVDEPMPDMPSKPESVAVPMTTATPAAAAAPADVLAAALKSGNFRDQDSFHKGSGLATIYRGPDGAYVLRLEDLDVTNGPDLHVLLSPHQDPMDRDELKTAGYVDIGKLKGNRGNQNYPIPDSVDVDVQQSVVIYCAPFHVIFSVAPLR